ncbi:MAG: hypothetical protein AABW79_02845 [Nanoarchaeota archaeon]
MKTKPIKSLSEINREICIAYHAVRALNSRNPLLKYIQNVSNPNIGEIHGFAMVVGRPLEEFLERYNPRGPRETEERWEMYLSDLQKVLDKELASEYF